MDNKLLLILLLLPILTRSQISIPPKQADSSIRGCGFIVKSCQNNCRVQPSNFVRWTVEGGTENISCQLMNPDTGNLAPIQTDPSNALLTTFDVPCCPNRNTINPGTGCPQCPTLPSITDSLDCDKCPNKACAEVMECPTQTANGTLCPQCPNTTSSLNCDICAKIPVDCSLQCPGSSEQTGSKPPLVCLDDERLHTLLILGVTTLTSILLMCLFIFMGLCFYRKKNRTYRMDGGSEENHSLSKEKKTPSTTLTISGCSQDNNTPSTSSQNLPPNYNIKTTNHDNKLNNQAEYENTEQVESTAASNLNRLSMQEYVNQEDLKNLMPNPNIPRSIQVKKDNFEMRNVALSNGPVPSNNKPPVVNGDFEIRGGFCKPKRTSTKSEAQSSKHGEAEDSPSDLSLTDDIALHFETKQKLSLFPELTEPDENPYVETPPTPPPIKSPRNQTKFESPDAYQTLMPANPNHTPDSNEYNMLLHNTAVANSETKALLFMNNNSHQQSGCKTNHKTEVNLLPSSNIATASEA